MPKGSFFCKLKKRRLMMRICLIVLLLSKYKTLSRKKVRGFWLHYVVPPSAFCQQTECENTVIQNAIRDLGKERSFSFFVLKTKIIN